MSDDPVYDKSRKLLEKLEQKAAHDEYLAKLQRIEALMDLNPDRESPEGEELEKLVDEVHGYEAQHYPITEEERIMALHGEIAGLKAQMTAHCLQAEVLQRENKTLKLGLEHALETLELQNAEIDRLKAQIEAMR